MELLELDVDGTPVRYRVAGTGPPVVLVHGLAGSWRWWSDVWPHLAKRRRVFLVDLPRLGRRQSAEALSAWLGRWLDAAGLDRVDVVGHSLGGLVAAEVAASRPERVRRLAVVAPAGIPCGVGLFRRGLRLVETLYGVRRHMRTVVADAARTSPVALLRGALFASDRDLRAELGRVDAPSLIVWGERDRLTPPSVAEEWRRLLPRSRLVVLPCAHVPMWDVPDRLAECLLAFLDEELGDEPGDDVRSRVVHGVGSAGDDFEARIGE
jgi:pimeloyl-ACP methyl ester carboxylesterase